MNYSNEAFVPPADQLRVVSDCAARVAPDNAEMLAWYKKYAVDQSPRIAHDLALINKHTADGAAIIEFGAVPLLLTAALKVAGYDLQAVDIDPSRFSRSIGEFDLDVSRCDIENEALPFDDGRFDLAVFNELFEHLRINPIYTMREVKRVLKPGGLLMLSSPNLRSLAGLANFFLKNRCYSCEGKPFEEYSKLEQLGHMGHVREYTTGEVSEFLSAIGFEVREIVYRGKYDKSWADGLCKIVAPLRPFVSYIAMKPKLAAS